MKSIWYLVGLVLGTMGVIIFLQGLYALLAGHPDTTVLGRSHPDLWWGGVMIVVGLLFILVHRNSSASKQ